MTSIAEKEIQSIADQCIINQCTPELYIQLVDTNHKNHKKTKDNLLHFVDEHLFHKAVIYISEGSKHVRFLIYIGFCSAMGLTFGDKHLTKNQKFACDECFFAISNNIAYDPRQLLV